MWKKEGVSVEEYNANVEGEGASVSVEEEEASVDGDASIKGDGLGSVEGGEICVEGGGTEEGGTGVEGEKFA